MLNPKALSVAFALVLLPATGFAQSPSAQTPVSEARAKVREACAGDVQKYCANVERGKGAVRDCLQAHETQLSDGCRTARTEREAARSKNKS
jgi:hypothetical protein